MNKNLNLQEALHALIEETEALGWDNPEQLDDLADVPSNQEAFALIGKFLSLKPLNTQLVSSTLAIVWNFAAPLSLEVLAPNKFLFKATWIGFIIKVPGMLEDSYFFFNLGLQVLPLKKLFSNIVLSGSKFIIFPIKI